MRNVFRVAFAAIALSSAALLAAPSAGAAPVWPNTPGEYVVQVAPSPEGGWYALTNRGGIWTKGDAPMYGFGSYVGYALSTSNPPLQMAMHGQFARGGLRVYAGGYTLTNTLGETYNFTGTLFANPIVWGAAERQIGRAGAYAEGGFWCAQFVSWVEQQAGTPGWVSTPSPAAIEDYAKSEGRWTRVPKPGDVAFMDLTNHAGTWDAATHIGIVAAVNGNQVVTIEGNADGDPNVVSVQVHTIGSYLYAFGDWGF